MKRLLIVFLICLAPYISNASCYNLLAENNGFEYNKVDGVFYLTEIVGKTGAWQTIKDEKPINIVDKIIVNDKLEYFTDSWYGTFSPGFCFTNVKFYKECVPIPSTIFLLFSGLFLVIRRNR